MTVEEFKTVLEKIKDYTDYIYLHVQGEPLLHKDIDKILLLCEGYNIKVNITTNGTLIHNYVDIINNSKSVRQINISLHSNSGDKNYYDGVMSSCKKISSNIYISYRLWNMNSLKPTKELDDIISKLSEYYNLSDEIKEKIRNDKSIKIDTNTFVDKDNLFEWPDMDNDIDSDGYCYGLNTHIGILSDGTVIPCCLDANGIINLGNIFNESLEDILNKKISTEIVNNFKNNKAVHPLCKKCNFRERFIK
jgi:radical SAM protein with 4Fe4S-binding SPASM domain